MIASWPMYLRPETRAALDALWSLTRDRLRDAGIAAPDRLDQDAPIHATWARDDLVIGQICNLPWRLGAAPGATLIGTGDYGLGDTPPGSYHSVAVIRADDPRDGLEQFDGARLALNSGDSQSGWGAAARALADAGASIVPMLTGAHRDSAIAVAEGRADLAFLDAVTWRMIDQWDGFAARLRVLTRTAPTPGLAFITAGNRDAGLCRAAMNDALAALSPQNRACLGLRALIPVDRSAYDALPVPPAVPVPPAPQN